MDKMKLAGLILAALSALLTAAKGIFAFIKCFIDFRKARTETA